MNNSLTKNIIIVLLLIFLLISCGGKENKYNENTRQGDQILDKNYDTAGDGSQVNVKLDGGFSIK